MNDTDQTLSVRYANHKERRIQEIRDRIKNNPKFVITGFYYK